MTTSRDDKALTSGPERVLVLRALGLGDLYAAVPALRGIRRRWGAAEITLAAPAALGQLMAGHGLVDRVVPAEGPRTPPRTPPWTGRPPDIAVNLHGRGPQSHRALAELEPRRIIGFACPSAGFPEGPPWIADEHEVDRWARLVAWAGGISSPDDLRLSPPSVNRVDRALVPIPPIVVHPGAASGSRRWPADRWAAVARDLANAGWPVVVTGGPGEELICNSVASAHAGIRDLCGALDLADLAALIGQAALLLSGDTGVAHLATAYRTPSVLLFGPTPPELWGPRIDEDLHHVLWRPMPGDPPGDPHGEAVDVRLDRIPVESVTTEARSLLAVTSVSGARLQAMRPSADEALGR